MTGLLHRSDKNARSIANAAGRLAVRVRGFGRARGIGRRDLALIVGAALCILLIGYAAFRPTPAPRSALLLRKAAMAAPPTTAAPPAVDPVVLMPVDARTAIEMNAAVPFATGPRPAAAAMTLALPDDDLQRATDCLAAAAGYEAGDDEAGERAVAQVVLNRLRNPAFPKAVCDVVFQGSERATGCQFTFTCDGSIDRRPLTAEAWARARTIAHAALTGQVYAPVGLSTHYHSEQVVPYWAASLDKLARIGTQIFYRWRGFWGTPPAFRAIDAGAEPIEPALAAYSDVHKPADQLLGLRVAAALARLTVRHDGAAFAVTLDKQIAADTLPGLAAALCTGLDPCVVIGRFGAAPRIAFAFRRDAGSDLALFDCARYKRATATECLTEPVSKAIQQDAARLALPPAPPPVAMPVATAETPVANPDPAPPPPASLAAAPTAVPKAELLPPKRVRADPCRAMRSVAAADRVGPCARGGY